MKNRTVIFLFPLSMLVLLGAGCLGFGSERPLPSSDAPIPATQAVDGTAPAEQAPVPAAYVQLDGGTADVTRDDTTVQAQDDMELDSGDRLSVTGGTVTVVYPDAGTSELDAGSSIVILSSSPQEGNLFTQIRLISGSIVTRFERLLGVDENFSVVGNGVVATVRGTAFRMALDNDAAEVDVMEHQVAVSAEDDDASSTQAIPGAPTMVGEGMAWHGRKDDARQAGGPKMRNLMRKMDKIDRANKWFEIGMQKIPKEKMRKPDHPVRLNIRSYVPGEFLQRMETLRQLREKMMAGASSTQ